jgi:hypothetical protein
MMAKNHGYDEKKHHARGFFKAVFPEGLYFEGVFRPGSDFYIWYAIC